MIETPRAPLAAAILIAVAVLMAFYPALGDGFVNYDDDRYVTENPAVRGGLTAAGLRWAWTATHAANWHPLTWISHMLDWQVYGPDPFGHHLTRHLCQSFHLKTRLNKLRASNFIEGRRWDMLDLQSKIEQRFDFHCLSGFPDDFF